MEFVVREATIDDARAIAQVQVESWKTTYAGIVPDAHLASLNVEEREEQWKEQFAAANSLMFVVESNVGIFGFVSGGKLREPIDGYDAESSMRFIFSATINEKEQDAAWLNRWPNR